MLFELGYQWSRSLHGDDGGLGSGWSGVAWKVIALPVFDIFVTRETIPGCRQWTWLRPGMEFYTYVNLYLKWTYDLGRGRGLV